MNRETNMFDGLKAYLTGYGRPNRSALACIAEYVHWPKAAQREIERRTTAILASLPDDEVCAIARREVNLCKLARQVQAELDEE
ncbi:hypothetical protein N5K27_28805 [Pigmentiphaga sp. GD03639]|uniref:hypothetical protein n=1 Tax=Pigmentiphaga sp. GD03639 TaxID=2975354 RepID=UPI002449F023|nr:hypothetical protein [Pigmentiphaga sp. GD03639]MDH2240297.1 hypothetical protein [Pigmentiphaga sp. GD03639]